MGTKINAQDGTNIEYVEAIHEYDSKYSIKVGLLIYDEFFTILESANYQ